MAMPGGILRMRALWEMLFHEARRGPNAALDSHAVVHQQDRLGNIPGALWR